MSDTADILDVATQLADENNAKGLEQWRASLNTGEEPDIDENGVRYCLDCAAVIPPERIAVAIPSPVRCVECQTAVESKRRKISDSSGILRAMNRATDDEERHMKASLRTATESLRDYNNKPEIPKDPSIYL